MRTNYPSNSMEHSPSKSNSSSAAEDISHLFRNQDYHSLVHSSPPLGPFLSYINQVHSLPPNFFTIHFNIPSTTVFSKWSLSFRFYYQNLVCFSPHTCHMTLLSHPQMGDIRSPAIVLCSWVITLLLGKVWASHSVAEDSGLVVCDAMSSGCSWYFKGSGTTFQTIHSTRHIFSHTAVTRDSWCQFEHLTSNNKMLKTYFFTVFLCLDFCNKF